ncbi:MAG: efflux RND transporter periplasmic adaptor subunit [Ignavibacteriota bacterium]
MKNHLFLAAVAIAFVAFGCKKEHELERKPEIQTSKEEESQIIILTHKTGGNAKLEYAVATSQLLPEKISAPAVLIPDADNEAVVVSPVEGVIEKIIAKEGDKVIAGEPLCYFRSTQLESYKAEYLRLESGLDLAHSTYERKKLLHEKTLLSDQEFLESENVYHIAQSDFRGIEGIISSLGIGKSDLGLDKISKTGSGLYALRSPISGTILMRNAIRGMKLDTTGVLFHIARIEQLSAEVQVSPNDANKISKGDKATFHIQGSKDDAFAGTVTIIGTTLNENTRTVTIRVAIANLSRILRPQQFGTADIYTNESKAYLSVPASSILEERSGDEIRKYAFVKKSDSTFAKTYISVLEIRGNQAAIASGLNEGDSVVSAGQFILKSIAEKDKLQEENE